jgi:hypothetical protein
MPIGSEPDLITWVRLRWDFICWILYIKDNQQFVVYIWREQIVEEENEVNQHWFVIKIETQIQDISIVTYQGKIDYVYSCVSKTDHNSRAPNFYSLWKKSLQTIIISFKSSSN